MTQATSHSNGQSTTSSAMLDRKLRALWRRQRLHTHGRGMAAVIVVLVVLVVGGLLVDWLLLLPPVARLLLLLGTIAAMFAVAYRQWWSHLRPYDPRRAALQVEKHYRQLDSALVAYVQFGQSIDGSSQLAAASRQQAAQLAERLSFTELVRFKDLRSWALAAVAAVIIVTGIGVQWPVAMATFGQRLINPFSDRPYPTRTQLTLPVTSQRVARGTVITLEAKVAGVIPALGQLELRYDDTDTWEALRLTVDEQGRLQHRIVSADRSFTYRFVAGDGRSPMGEVTVVAPPRVRQVTVTLDHPPYTGLGERSSESLNLRAPAGTTASIRLALDRPVSAAEVIELDEADQPVGEPLELALTADGQTATWRLPVRTMTYRLRWSRSIEGETYRFSDPVQYQMHAVPDAPPQVQILEPTSRSQVGTLNKRLPLTFRARDDHGLTEAWVVYRHRHSGEEHRIAIGELEGRPSSQKTFVWSLRESMDELEVGDELEYTIEVADNREHEGGRQRGHAAPWRSIEILSVEAFMQQLTERQVESFERLQQVGEQTSESRDTVRQLEYEASTPNRTDQSDRNDDAQAEEAP